ncbi:hypothetical protein LBMAG27_15200 [Bacteroidota bacterium]|nr:hypothetical protein LBMAG27_15200 [Bacteroidota bacterium]
MPLKIFIGNNPIYLCQTGFVLPSTEALELSSKILLQEKFIDSDSLLQVIEKLENKKYEFACMLYHFDESALIKEFISLFKQIDAAGGLVENIQDEVLMIFRKGKWDLPKGKVEKNEKKIEAAEREVEEETGIQKLKVKTQINFYPWKQEYTTHTYWENQKRIIKNTYWYLMKSTSDLNFIPQKEEGITDVKWIKKDQVNELLKNSYASVADVFRYFNT